MAAPPSTLYSDFDMEADKDVDARMELANDFADMGDDLNVQEEEAGAAEDPVDAICLLYTSDAADEMD